MERHVISKSNPFSTGDGGGNYEHYVQTYIAIHIITGGKLPFLPSLRPVKMIVQGNWAGYNTDDCIVIGEKNEKALCQITHQNISIRKKDEKFKSFIINAWKDFCNTELFQRETDSLLLIVPGLSQNVKSNMERLFDLARNSTESEEFIAKLRQPVTTSEDVRKKYVLIKDLLENSKIGTVDNDGIWWFIRCFRIHELKLDYWNSPLFISASNMLSKVVGERGAEYKLYTYICNANQNAGTINRKKLFNDLELVELANDVQGTSKAQTDCSAEQERKKLIDSYALKIKEKSRSIFEMDSTYARDVFPARLASDGLTLIPEKVQKLSHEEFPKVKQTSKNTPKSKLLQFSLFEYLKNHISDDSITRHIYLSGESGAGKSTFMYELWHAYLSDEQFIPIYVSLKNIGSIEQYLEKTYLNYLDPSIKFDWFKNEFVHSRYHILLLLDGYNEIALNLNPEYSKAIKEAILDIFNIDKITVIITSRNPEMPFEDVELTELTVCHLNRCQITAMMGGRNDYLPKVIHEGMLDNPFMLEICIKAFARDEKHLFDINQVSMEEVFSEYFSKQVDGLKLSPEDKVLVNVILPLAAMRLDERINTDGEIKVEEINEDPVFYKWNDFESAVKKVQSECITYSPLINKYGPRYDRIDPVYLISTDPNAAVKLLRNGKNLEIFKIDSDVAEKVIWDHEIYRDFFVAKGYAMYSAYNEQSEDCVYNLAKQINYRFPEPDIDKMNPKVSGIIREYHLRKAQMFVDIVDNRLDYHKDLQNTGYLEKMKQTSVYRRLTRDIAFIYEDLDHANMAQAAELSEKYYSDDIETYSVSSKYDYQDKDRRYADAAYSLSGLAYNFVHDRIPADKKEHYLEQADITLGKAERIFDNLVKSDSKVLENLTVRDDRIKARGNRAAYHIAKGKRCKNQDEKEEQFKLAISIHEANRNERKEIKEIIEKKQGDTRVIENSIAQSTAGMAIAYYYLGQYDDAIALHDQALNLRPDDSENYRQQKYKSYLDLIGCYAAKSEYRNEDTLKALCYIENAFKYANENNIYKGFNDLIKKVAGFKGKMTEEQKTANKEILDRIETESISLEEKSFNSVIRP